MKNWKSITIKQDRLFYDFEAKRRWLLLICWDDNQVNFPIRSYGLLNFEGLFNQFSFNYESLPIIGSVLGASLIDINKSNQNGCDIVSMTKQFFSKANGTNIIKNNVSRKQGKTFWYEIWPCMAFSMLIDLYPKKTDITKLLKINAGIWVKVMQGLSKRREYPGFNNTSFSFDEEKGYYSRR